MAASPRAWCYACRCKEPGSLVGIPKHFKPPFLPRLLMRFLCFAEPARRPDDLDMLVAILLSGCTMGSAEQVVTYNCTYALRSCKATFARLQVDQRNAHAASASSPKISGRNTLRGMPVTAKIALHRSGGILLNPFSHLEISGSETPSSFPSSTHVTRPFGWFSRQWVIGCMAGIMPQRHWAMQVKKESS
jgi:hypothetical protein